MFTYNVEVLVQSMDDWNNYTKNYEVSLIHSEDQLSEPEVYEILWDNLDNQAESENCILIEILEWKRSEQVSYTKYSVRVLIETDSIGFLNPVEKELSVYVPSNHSNPEQYMWNDIKRRFPLLIDILEYYEE